MREVNLNRKGEERKEDTFKEDRHPTVKSSSFSSFYFRSQFCKSTTCDLASDEILSNESTLDSSKATTMNRMRPGSTRRFSLIKLELPASDPNSSTTGSNRSSTLPTIFVVVLRLSRWFQKFSSICESQSSAKVTLSTIQSQDSSLLHGDLRKSSSCDAPRTRHFVLVWRQCIDDDGLQWPIEVSNECISLSSAVVSRANEKIFT